MPPVIKWLIIANVVVFVTRFFSDELAAMVFTYGALWPIGSEFFAPWQYVTTMFLHGDFLHIMLNMFILWMFGIEIATLWGPKKFLSFYLLSGIGASIIHSVVTMSDSVQAPAVGASGAIFGVLVAFGMMFPNRMVLMMFLFPMRAKYAVLIFIAIDLYAGLANQPGDMIAHFAHLGGALTGFLLIKTDLHEKIARMLGDTPYSGGGGPYSGGGGPYISSPPPRRSPFSRTDRNESARIIDARYHDVPERSPRNAPVSLDFGDQQEQVDAILDKISREGYNALTPEEREILMRASGSN